MSLIRGITVLLNSADEVIDAVGGTAAAARLVAASIASVSNWRARDRLPPRTFLLFEEALDVVGAAASSTLWGIDPPRGARAAMPPAGNHGDAP
jgi:hypothetical protein